MSIPSVTGLDHYIIRVNDLDEATNHFRALGFALAPPGRHHQGTRNQTIILDANYLELLHVPSEIQDPSRFPGFAPDYDGPVAVALQTLSSEAVHEEFALIGINAEKPVSGGRPVILTHGTFDAAWKNTRFPDGVPPIPAFFTCGHLTRNLVYRPEWQDHENTARRVAELIVLHDNPALLVAPYKQLFGAITVGDVAADGTLEVRRGTLHLKFLPPEVFKKKYPLITPPASLCHAWFAGSVIEVRDIEKTRQIFLRNKVSFAQNESHELVVSLNDGAGALLVFRQE